MVSFPEQGFVYWYDPEPTRGSEMRKVRPCIIVSPNIMNSRLHTVIVVPLTTNTRPLPFRFTISLQGQKSSVACDQIRVADKSRLKSHIAELKPGDKSKLFEMLHKTLSE